ncbi:MAG: hypothetical protein AAGD25_25590 [Cyanobacteria bacterium P01_F01_bin.150]
MSLDERVRALEQKLAAQIALSHRQQRQINVLHKQLTDLRLKLLVTQESIVAQSVQPKLSSVEMLSNRNSEIAVYAFGGMQTRLGMPPGEFMRSLDSLKVDQVFFKDFYQCWYLRGLLGYTNGLVETIEWLKDFKQRNGHKTVITLGTSAGGYAAIVFGVAIQASTILSFVPQTHLTMEVFNRFQSLFSSESEFQKAVLNSEEFLDLDIYLGNQPKTPIIQIFYGEECLLDKVAAEHIGSHKNVSLHPVKGVKFHGETLNVLKNKGALATILRKSVSEVS